MINSSKIPNEIKEISKAFEKAGFEIYLVGGCVRDLLLEKTPKDWDFTTNATPEQIQGLFIDSFYENNFGTVGIKIRKDDETIQIAEVTPYRIEANYSDNRHPDFIKFGKKLEQDLERRDFTINAMAYDIYKGQIKDIFKGQDDLKRGLVRAVGNPDDRFKEDSLRMLRAVRFASQLGFSIEQETAEYIQKNSNLMKNVSRERIGEEFTKLIMSPNPMIGLVLAQKLDILEYISPVFKNTFHVEQNKQAHKYDVWEHLLRSLQHAADKNYPLEIRLAALFHDISKPETKRTAGGKTTFFGHDVVGANVTRETLNSLRFSRETIKKVEKLVRYHMFFSDTEEITLSAVRRLVAKVGKEDIWDLINLRICDRIGSGRPKEEPYRLRKFQSMIEEVMRDPISVSMLKIDGNAIMEKFHTKPGPKIGYVLHALLEEVLDDPSKNTEMFLVKRAEELLKLPEKSLIELGEKGKEVIKDIEEEEVEKLRSKRNVN